MQTWGGIRHRARGVIKATATGESVLLRDSVVTVSLLRLSAALSLLPGEKPAWDVVTAGWKSSWPEGAWLRTSSAGDKQGTGFQLISQHEGFFQPLLLQRLPYTGDNDALIKSTWRGRQDVKVGCGVGLPSAATTELQGQLLRPLSVRLQRGWNTF